MIGGRDFAAGERIGGYRIEALAGRGAMAMVYRARQLRPERLVALKVILPEYSDDAGFRARFERESNLAALIEHPNVLPIYEVSEQDGVLFIAMRYVDGGDLSALLGREGPIAAAEAVRIVTQVAGALGAAHAHGLVLSEFGDYPGAIERAEASLKIARAEGDDRLTAHALHALAMARAKQGDPAAALALADEGLLIARRVGDPDLDGNLHRGRSFSLDELGRDPEARGALEESLRFYRLAGDRIGAARSHNILGVFEITAGNLDAAVEHIRESLAVARELGDSLGMFSASVNLGVAAWLNGDSAGARLWFTDTLKEARRSGALSIVAYALFGLALTTTSTDDARTAATLHGAVDALFDQHGAGLEALESRLPDTAQAQLRAALGAATFEATYRSGRALPTDDAITLALSAG